MKEYSPVTRRFLNYIRFDTQSSEESTKQPSTDKQWALLKNLEAELRELGLIDVKLDNFGYLMATLPSNSKKELPALGFIAHVDTSPDMSGADVKAQFVEKYDGGDIVLNKEQNIVLSPSNFPELKDYVGETLITTDGTTLLGADDKAGVAEIVTAVEYLLSHPQIEHGPVKIGFTPDEEIGRGVDNFDVKAFGAQFAYTMDGGAIGELEYENFNAASAKVFIQGCNVHPGYAKDKMLNAMQVAMAFHAMLPEKERPEHTCGYEGFFHLIKMEGTVENASLQYIIRDHDSDKFAARKALMEKCGQAIADKFGKDVIRLEIKDQYRNMKEMVEPYPFMIERAVKAMEQAGVKPVISPIRGGTDGAQLSFMGLPCPNLFAGGLNFHGKFEFVPVNSMEKAVQVIVNLVKLYS